MTLGYFYCSYNIIINSNIIRAPNTLVNASWVIKLAPLAKFYRLLRYRLY